MGTQIYLWEQKIKVFFLGIPAFKKNISFFKTMVFLFGTLIFTVAFAISWKYRNNEKVAYYFGYYGFRLMMISYLLLAVFFGIVWLGSYEEAVLDSTQERILGFPAYFKEACVENKEYCFPLVQHAVVLSSVALHLQKTFLLYCCDVIDMECDVPVILSAIDKIIENHFSSHQ